VSCPVLSFWQIVMTQTQHRKRTLLDWLAEDLPPRFLPTGTPFPFTEKGRCRWCGELVRPPRRTWCSEACVREWTVRTSGSFVRSYVWERDQGVCAECGADTSEMRRLRDGTEYRVGLQGEWDADHIVPVWKGGGLAGLDGYQTLCKTCHSAKTAADAAERAAIARASQPNPSRQSDLFPQLALALP
jgi:5-methylcytosine-specific restriction enzyme A